LLVRKWNKVYICWIVFGIFVFASMQRSEDSKIKNSTSDDLKKILGNTATYCEKLKTAVFHFVCDEKVEETIEQWLSYGIKNWEVRDFLKKRRTRINRDLSKKSRKYDEYISQYQVIQKDNQIKEYRLLLRDNGKKVLKKDAKLNTVIYSRNVSLSPLILFAIENQDKFIYKILKKKKIMDRNAFVVEIKLKKKAAKKSIFATAWVDTIDFSVLKFKAFPDSFRGYDYLVRIADKSMENVKISDTHYFGYQRNGIRFPTKVQIVLSYNQKLADEDDNHFREVWKWTKIRTTFAHKNHRFFNVTVDAPTVEPLNEVLDVKQ